METSPEEKEPLFIPKGFGIGWTLNFNNKWSYWVLAGIFAFVLTVVGLSMYLGS